MSFLSLFTCCLGRSKPNPKSAEAEARHARIVEAYNNAGSNINESPITSPPPCYADIARDRVFVPMDEKSSTASRYSNSHEPLQQEMIHLQPYPPLQPHYPSSARRSSVSSQSSVISVPSTRLSDLTSMYTGNGSTRRGQRSHGQHHSRNQDRDATSEEDGMSEAGDSWCDSGYHGSRNNDSSPPSYYAGSERSITPVPAGDGIAIPPPAMLAQHPVMQPDWLERLRFQEERFRRQRQ